MTQHQPPAHPHQLHARAVCWSLSAALPRLAAAHRAAASAAAADGDRGTLQAWRPGSGVSGGGAGDALLDAVILHASPAVANPYAERLHRTCDTVAWVARTVLADRYRPAAAALPQLVEHTPSMPPAHARNVALWVDEQDVAVRRILRERDDRVLVPGARCPHCDTAGALAIRTAGPRAQWVVGCTAGCTCDGPGCGCGMGIEDVGVGHIWTVAEIEAALPAPEEAGSR